MENRRDFFKSITLFCLAGLTGLRGAEPMAQTPIIPSGGPENDRGYWVGVTERLANPILQNLARRQLRKNMPVEAANPANRAQYTYLEAFGRLLAGIAPWLGTPRLAGVELQQQRKFIQLAQASLDMATDPGSPDFMNFDKGGQPMVDAAFMAEGILRAPGILWDPLEPRVRRQIIEALKSTRAISTPRGNNWVMFAAMIETALLTMGEPTIEERLEGCLRHMLGWYDGDGAYGDGAFFHWDYYNSFVIHPMLVDVLAVLRQKDSRFEPVYAIELRRAQRYAAMLERLVAPDGTFPSIGRSTTYRFGALQELAQIALMHKLPESVKPAQVRCALTAVIRRMTEASGTFDEHGWLRIGFCGHQPSLAERYISTGSLYLCSVALLPLGLPANDPFWSEAATEWTSQQLWSGKSVHPDHALWHDVKEVKVPSLHRPK